MREYYEVQIRYYEYDNGYVTTKHVCKSAAQARFLAKKINKWAAAWNSGEYHDCWKERQVKEYFIPYDGFFTSAKAFHVQEQITKTELTEK